MFEHDASLWFLNAMLLTALRARALTSPADARVPPEFVVNEDLRGLLRHCHKLNLPVSSKFIERVAEKFESEGGTFEDLEREIDAIRNAIVAELGALTFFTLDARFAGHFANTQPFGTVVAEKFPGAAYDVEEAAKCLALSRSTACVFHLMRVMEVG